MRPSARKPSGGCLVHRAWLLALWAFASCATALFLSANDPLGTPENLRLAYIGPGAGFAFLGSFLSLLIAFILGAASLLIWPFRMAWRALTRRKGLKRARVRKVIFLGLDGLDPDLSERFMAEGKMPHLAKLREQGAYSRLRTTFPPLSPVAWSTFATGVNPGKHSMYDFLNRSMRTYVPELSSSRVGEPKKFLKIGKWRIPLDKPTVELRRKSRTFWNILGEHQVGCTVLRVPITFPPEKFDGKLLSAMCTPDLLGTQGTFHEFSTALEQASFESGMRFPLRRDGKGLQGTIEGPSNPIKETGPMKIGFRIVPNGAGGTATLEIEGRSHALKRGEYSPWIQLTFRAGMGVKVRGVARFRITATEPEYSVYVTPINLDPENPALPISHPTYYATYLAKLLGTYSTLGLAEDTWALNERVIDEQGFLDQVYSICEERKAMFFSALEKTKQGVVACVFDTSDRVQHMFYRYLEPDHPAHKTNGNGSGDYAGVIEDLYQRMDDIAGKTLTHVDDETVLFVLSDHGFKSFQRGVNLNVWLLQNGYLHLKNGASEGGPYLRDIDWSRTRVYVFGLAGVYINQKGREARGIVAPGEEAKALKKELAEKLTGLIDDERNTVAIQRAYAKEDVYKGPYAGAAPDVVIGYNAGYRNSWSAATGTVTGSVFEDNTKAWSGDHCVDPPMVPGVIFCNRKFEEKDPGIEDLAPTTLTLFGLKPPDYMDGHDLAVTAKTEPRP